MEWTIEKDNYLVELWPNTGMHRLAEMFGTSYYQIRKRGTELGLQAKNCNFHRGDLWPEWRVERLLELYEAGLRYRDIAHRLNVTRNAVIGKLHRLGLSEPQKKATHTPLDNGLTKTCRWPTGNNEEEYAMGFGRVPCNEKPSGKRSYCDHHHGIAYRKAEVKPDRKPTGIPPGVHPKNNSSLARFGGISYSASNGGIDAV